MAASAPQALVFPVGVTCVLPVLTSTLHLALHPLPAPPANPFRRDDHCNVRWDECALGSWAHEAETLDSAKDHHTMVSRDTPWYIMAPTCQFGGFGMGRDDGRASIVRWDREHPLQPPRMGLTCGRLIEASKDGAYWCRCRCRCRQVLTVLPYCTALCLT